MRILLRLEGWLPTSSFVIMWGALLSFVLCMDSYNSVFSALADSGTDSSVFRYTALVMMNGGAPYVDAFDHKGPLIFFYNYIGALLSYDHGIWLIELVSMVVTVYFMYHTALLMMRKSMAMLCVTLAGTSLSWYMERGNFTEEYALPFIALAMFIFMDYFLNTRLNLERLFLLGISMGAVCLLRPNMVAVWGVGGVMLAYYLLRDRGIKHLILDLFVFVVGLALAISAAYVWLDSYGAVSEAWHDFIAFNMSYTSDSTRASGWHRLISFVYFAANPFVMLAVGTYIYRLRQRRQQYVVFVAMSILLSLVLICISGQRFPHYGMVLVPLFVVSISDFLRMMHDDTASWSRIVRGCISVVTIVMLTGSSLAYAGMVWRGVHTAFIGRYHDADIQEIVHLIDGCTNPGERIAVVGNYDLVYVMSKRLAVSRYSYQSPIAKVRPEIGKEFLQDLMTVRPRLVVRHRENAGVDEFLNRDGYREIYHGQTADVYFRDDKAGESW